ncbi:MAG: TolB family protein [Myxococcota bacterium]
MLPLILVVMGARVALPVHEEWRILDGEGREVEVVRELGGLKPKALEPVGCCDYVFTARVAGETHDSLWIFSRSALRRLGHPAGRHSFPFPSADGAWVYFSYHADPDFMGSGREYTQIWRARIRDNQLEQMTTGHGCKLTPSIDPKGRLWFAHARCEEGSQGIERLDGARLVEVISPTLNKPTDPRLSPDGRHLAFTQLEMQTMRLMLKDLHSGAAPKELWASPSGVRGSSLHLRWLSRTRVAFVYGDDIALVDIGGRR